MKRVYLLLIFAALLFAQSAFAVPGNYTADMVIGSTTLHIARMNNKVRIVNPQLKDIVSIRDMNSKKAIVLSTSDSTYYEHPLSMSVLDMNVKSDKVRAGESKIYGKSCIIYKSTFYTNENNKYEAQFCEAKELDGLIIQISITDPKYALTNSMYLKNIKLNNATDEMFHVPEYFRKVPTLSRLRENWTKQ